MTLTIQELKEKIEMVEKDITHLRWRFTQTEYLK